MLGLMSFRDDQLTGVESLNYTYIPTYINRHTVRNNVKNLVNIASSQKQDSPKVNTEKKAVTSSQGLGKDGLKTIWAKNGRQKMVPFFVEEEDG